MRLVAEAEHGRKQRTGFVETHGSVVGADEVEMLAAEWAHRAAADVVARRQRQRRQAQQAHEPGGDEHAFGHWNMVFIGCCRPFKADRLDLQGRVQQRDARHALALHAAEMADQRLHALVQQGRGGQHGQVHGSIRNWSGSQSQFGQRQCAGRLANGVPGAICHCGSPRAGS
jgi:hypothetical protein